MHDIKYIPPDILEEINSKADLLDIIRHWHPELVKSGSSFRGKCPSCASDKFSVTPAKSIVKCFKCDLGANNAIGYLREFRGMKFLDAGIWLANHLNISIPDSVHTTVPLSRGTGSRGEPGSSRRRPLSQSDNSPSLTPDTDHSFRDDQLRASGITEEAQQIIITSGDKEEIINRYSAGSVDSKFMPIPGHDMLIHYYDLDGVPVMYTPKHGKAEKPYIRIRHKYPATHTDQEGKPIRYMSPPGSKNHLWIPEYIRRKYQAHTPIDSLVFVEGEKKADALCLAGIDAVGIAGIHNFASDNEMPAQIERLITTCAITNVIFWFDSDIDALGGDLFKNTDSRPRTFARAAIKFRAYFYKFAQEHINIQVWICHGIDTTHKGADDLLLSLVPLSRGTDPASAGSGSSQRSSTGGTSHTDQGVLSADLHLALHSHTSEGEHIRMHLITSASDAQIYEIWHLHSPTAFMHHHQEQLKTLPEFRINKHRYRWSEAESRFESVQKLLPSEQYWFVQDTKYGPQHKFDHLNITYFLQARGFWRQRIALGKFRHIRVQSGIIEEVCPEDVQQYVYDFTAGIEEYKVLRMLMSGGSQYFGPEKLKNLKVFEPQFVQPSRDQEILCFRDKFWKITPKGITEHKYVELPGSIWANDVNDFSPTYIQDFFTINHDPESPIPWAVESKYDSACDILRYINRTSDIHWRDARPTPSTFPEGNDPMEEKDLLRINTLMTCMIDKIIAIGYLASSFMDPASMRAIIAMDAQESKGGHSQGGTGKSLFARMFEFLFPVHKINGKQARLTEDQFLYDGVDERTRMILVDDCRRTTDFEAFFSFITGGVTANSKGISKMYVGLKRWLFTTNFSIRGEDRSHVRRQYTIAFSDFFSPERDPVSEFGHALFDEWVDTQWNYYYNFIAHCIQFQMQQGLKAFAPDADIKRRKLRDMIGEIWLDFLEGYFYTGSDYINRRFEIEKLLEAFGKKNPSQKAFAIKTIFKDKADMFCRYAGFNYNIPEIAGKDGRIRNGSKGLEYFCISDHEFDINKYHHDINTAMFDSSHLPDF